MLDIHSCLPTSNVTDVADLLRKADFLLAKSLLEGTAKYVRPALAFLKLKYPVSYSELSRIAELLCQVFHKCTGNVADETDIATSLTFVLKLLNKLPDCPAHGSGQRFVIAWKPLYETLLRVQLHGSSWEEYALHPPLPMPLGAEAKKVHAQAMVNLLRRARNFFDATAASEIVATLRPYMCPDENGLFRAVGLLCLMLPENVDSSFVEDAFKVWSWIPNCLEWAYLWTHFFSRIARHGDSGIHSCLHANLPRLYEALLRTLELPTSKDSAQRPELLTWPSECAFLLARTSYKNETVKKMTRLITFTYGSDTNSKELLSSTMLYLKPFYNPLNEGAWTSALDMLLKMLTLNFTKRIAFESGTQRTKRPWQPRSKITELDVAGFVDIMLPIALTAFDSKDHSMSFGASQALKDLVSLQADVVFPTVLDRLIPALENSMKPHEALNAMETFGVVLSALLRSDGGLDSPLLAQMLQQTLAGIDNNDPFKTVKTLRFVKVDCCTLLSVHDTLLARMYMRVVTMVPLMHPLDMPGTKPEIVFVMPDWTSEVLERIWKFLSNIPTLKKGSGLDYVLGSNVFSQFLEIFFQQMSPTLYEASIKQICHSVASTYYPPAKKYFGQILRAAVYANPTSLKQLIPVLHEKILQKNGSDLVGNAEETSYWVHLLGDVVSRGGEQLLSFSVLLDHLMEIILLHEDKELRQQGQKLLRKSLGSYLNVLPEDVRSLPASKWNFAKCENFADLVHPNIQADLAAMTFRFPNDAVQQRARELIEQVFSRVEKLLMQEGATLSASNLRAGLGCLEALVRGGASLFADKQATFESVLSEENEFDADEDDSTIGMASTLTLQNKQWSLEMRKKFSELLLRLCDRYAVRENPDVVSIKALIRVLQSFLSHNGFKANAKSHHLNYDKAVYRLWKNGFPSTYTRNLIVLKAQALLIRRMSAGIWSLSPESETLLKRLLSLCTHEYSAVRKKAQKAIPMVIRRYPQFSNRVVSFALDVIVRQDSTKAAVNGAIYVLNTAPNLKRIARQWPHISDLIVGLLSAHYMENMKVQVRLAELWNSFVPYTSCLSFPSRKSDEGIDQTPASIKWLSREQTDALVVDCQSFKKRRLSKEESAYSRLMLKVEDALFGTKLHWRFELLAASAFSLFVRKEKEFPVKFLNYFVQNLTSEVLPLRQLCRGVLPALTQSYELGKRTMVSSPMEMEPQACALKFSDLDLNLDVARWKGPLVDCLWRGWNSSIDTALVLDANSLKGFVEVRGTFDQFLDDAPAVVRACDLIASDHRLSGDERATEADKAMTGMALPSSAVLTLYNGCWQWPRTPAAPFSSAFSRSNVFALETILKVGKAKAWDRLWPALQGAMVKTTDREQQCFAAELFCAVGRSALEWEEDLQNSVLEKLELVSANHLQNAPVDATSEWMEALRLIACNRDPRRFQWLSRAVAAWTAKPDLSTASLLNDLRLQQALLIETGWRGYSLASALIPFLLNMLSGASKTIREEAARCLFFAAQIDIALPELSDTWRLGYTEPSPCSREPLMTNFTAVCQRSLERHMTYCLAERVDSLQSKAIHQEIEGVMYFFIHASRIGRAAPIARFMNDALRLSLAIQEDSDREFAQVGKIASQLICAVAPRQICEELLNRAAEMLQQSSSWRVRLGATDAVRVLAHRAPLDAGLRARALSVFQQALLDQVLDVRQFAQLCFAGLLRMLPAEDCRKIISSAPKPRKRGNKSSGSGDGADSLILRHSKVLAVCAAVLSHPTELPEWMADAITALCMLHDEDPIIKQTIITTIGEFKKTHQDSWDLVRMTWTSEQLSVLSDFSGSRSYFS